MNTMRFKTRRAVAQELLNSDRFAAELVAVANQAGKSLTEARKEADAALRALVSVQIPFFEFLFDRGLVPLHARGWSLDVDWATLNRLRNENANKSLRIATSFDHLVGAGEQGGRHEEAQCFCRTWLAPALAGRLAFRP